MFDCQCYFKIAGLKQFKISPYTIACISVWFAWVVMTITGRIYYSKNPDHAGNNPKREGPEIDSSGSACSRPRTSGPCRQTSGRWSAGSWPPR